ALHCLDLRSGARLWKVERREDDLYLAGVFQGKVLVVGKQSCRALRLGDGKVIWTVKTGLPAGKGGAVGKTYYLPLKPAVPEGVVPVFGASTLAVLGSSLGQGPLLAVSGLVAGRIPEKRASVCALDLDQGAIRERLVAPRSRGPGNLIL